MSLLKGNIEDICRDAAEHFDAKITGSEWSGINKALIAAGIITSATAAGVASSVGASASKGIIGNVINSTAIFVKTNIIAVSSSVIIAGGGGYIAVKEINKDIKPNIDSKTNIIAADTSKAEKITSKDTIKLETIKDEAKDILVKENEKNVKIDTTYETEIKRTIIKDRKTIVMEKDSLK